ncbi:MAG: glycosyltransferase family 2 protein [Bacteroidota bacterium]
MTPKVSVLTTVYNREKYLGACIESVLNSDYEDWELIIVDDGSTDNSVSIAEKFAVNDQRIKLYVNEKNVGDYPNRNRAASYARGKYLKYLDADDLIYSHGLRVMIEMMEAHPQCALGISQKVAEDFKPYPFVMLPSESFKREFLQRGVLKLGPTGTIIRKENFEALGCFTGTRYIGDTEMWYKLALHHPVLKMVPGLVFWRQHDDQEITRGQNSFFYLENTFKLQISTLNHSLMPLSEYENKLAVRLVHQRFSRNLIRLLKNGEFQKANQIRRSCNLTWVKVFKSAAI